jgi:hypothetical protein
MVRLITCQQATLLMEKRHDHALQLPQRAGLWLHLRYCPYCSRYARQTVMVAQLARQAAVHSHSGLTLPHASKERMRQRLVEAL